jgi:acyl-coenzyme A synthetase/AMP-(fatty) acid ligase
LLPSPFATKEAQLNLLDTTKATTYLHTEYNGAAVKSITSERPGVQAIPVPELGQWLCDQDARHYEYSKTWDEAKSEPWIIFHTSGTTGKLLESLEFFLASDVID